MPSVKTLLLTLFLAIFVLLLVVVFVRKTKPIPDAEIYAKQNPNCTTIKIHANKNSLVECFLNFESLSDFPKTPQGTDTLYISMAKFIGERFPKEFPLRVRHIFSIPDETTDSIGIYGNSIAIVKSKNSIWHNKSNGCKFPGPCPVSPLRGIGGKNYVINAILPGKVIKIEEDSLFSITIYHGENIYSKMSGITNLNDYAQIEKSISPDSALGLIQNKTAFHLEVTRNGKRERWEKFYKESRE